MINKFTWLTHIVGCLWVDSWHDTNLTREHELPLLGGGGWVFLGFSGGGWSIGFVVGDGHGGWLGFSGLFFFSNFIFMDCCSSCCEKKKWCWKSTRFVFVAGSPLYSCAEFDFFIIRMYKVFLILWVLDLLERNFVLFLCLNDYMGFRFSKPQKFNYVFCIMWGQVEWFYAFLGLQVWVLWVWWCMLGSNYEFDYLW